MYVGGGSLVSLLGVWKAHGIDQIDAGGVGGGSRPVRGCGRSVLLVCDSVTAYYDAPSGSRVWAFCRGASRLTTTKSRSDATSSTGCCPAACARLWAMQRGAPLRRHGLRSGCLVAPAAGAAELRPRPAWHRGARSPVRTTSPSLRYLRWSRFDVEAICCWAPRVVAPPATSSARTQPSARSFATCSS